MLSCHLTERSLALNCMGNSSSHLPFALFAHLHQDNAMAFMLDVAACHLNRLERGAIMWCHYMVQRFNRPMGQLYQARGLGAA